MSQSPLQLHDYYPAPFWFLNHQLEEDELRLQLELMKEQGIHAFFMHPRAGLLTPYGSQKWFEIIRWIVDEAEKLGMKAWLYDEDPFPSGPAGGRIFLDHPEFAARGLVFHELLPDDEDRIDADLGEGRLLEALAVRCDEAGNVLESRDIFAEVGVLRTNFFHTLWPSPYYVHLFGKSEYPHYRAETFFPHLQLQTKLEAGWKVYAVTAVTVEGSKYRFIPDNLNPDCVQEFIRLTHEKYREVLGDKFGNAVPGIFTDETAVGSPYPWTGRFAEEFRKRRHFSADNQFYRLFTGNSQDNQKFRLAYWETVQELFIESFFAPINDWCHKHGLALCGHGIGEEDPIATTGGMNIFNLQKYVGIPGFDHITPNIPDGKTFKSLNLGGKLVASAAEQLGEHRVQSECFGCNAYNFGHDAMKRNLRWLYSLGVNWLVPHGFHYSYDGRRKDDAGKSFFFQSPDYPQFHRFGAYAARLGYLLGESRSHTRLCVLYPEKTFRRLIPGQRPEAIEKREQLYDCLQFLFDHQLQFDLTDEQSLQQATIREGQFQCGKCIYDKLLLPFQVENECLEKLEQCRIPVLQYPQDAPILLANPDFKFVEAENGSDAEDLMIQYRRNAAGRLLYVFNNRNSPRRLRLALYSEPAANRYYYDVDSDVRMKLDHPDTVFELAAYGALVIELYTQALPDAVPYRPVAPEQPDLSCLSQPEWDYIPPVPGLLHAFRDWQWLFNGQDYGLRRYALLREVVGTTGNYRKIMRPRPVFDRAPAVPVPYPGNLQLSANFHLEKVPARLVLLAENDSFAGQAELRLNGQALPPFTRKRVYDPWNIVSEITALCQIGENILTITWPKAEEFDGLNSMLYLMTDEA